jgi:hypothetical protein
MKNVLLAFSVFLFAEASARANLIVNGGFETGTLSPWSKTNNVSVVTSGPHTGTNDALFSQIASPSFNSLSQTISTSTGNFDLDFWLLYNNSSSANNQEFKVTFDGVTIIDLITQLNSGGGGYVHIQQSGITSAHVNPLLTFQSVNPAFFMRLDDVNLVAVPVPEPSSLTLAGFGVLGFVTFQIRRRQRSVSF